jgi:diacylglycerol O-acyltransferase / trehalose O-mycolyltransferase
VSDATGCTGPRGIRAEAVAPGGPGPERRRPALPAAQPARTSNAPRAAWHGDTVGDPAAAAQGRRPRRVRVPARTALFVALLLSAGCAAAVPGGTQAPALPRMVAATALSARVVDLVIDSPAVGPRVPVRLLLPAGYAAQPQRRWPVLYLLHGASDGYRAWTRSTDVEQLTASSDVLVVMPDGGPAGFYSDWRSGSPRWETFHLVELWELLRADYRAADRRAVAGLSMGGLGALGYAARHPGMFTAAASFSGVAHTRLAPGHYQELVRSQGGDPQQLWGDPVENADIWAAHNPFDLAARLAGIPLHLSVGDGRPGPLDPPRTPIDDLGGWCLSRVADAAQAWPPRE